MPLRIDPEATDIRRAVAAARRFVPRLGDDYVERALADGRPIEAVKVELFDMISANTDWIAMIRGPAGTARRALPLQGR